MFYMRKGHSEISTISCVTNNCASLNGIVCRTRIAKNGSWLFLIAFFRMHLVV